MALIICKECGKEISDKAASCPNCGYVSKKLPIQETSTDENNKSNTNSWTGWLIVFSLLVMAYATNPNKDAHHSKIREAVYNKSTLASVLGIGYLAALSTDYHSIYGLASYTNHGEDIITIGIFGTVVYFE